MANRTEAFARAKIDALLKDAGWDITDGTSVHFEYALSDGTRADYALCDRRGRPLAVLEAKKTSIDPITAQDQGKAYADLLDVPFVFLSNGEEIWFFDKTVDAHARRVATVFSQDDLERRIAVYALRRDVMTVPTDTSIAGGGGRQYQLDCIDTLCSEVALGRRKMLVEMATGTGKTRTAAAFIKRLFDAGIVTRVLFLVDRLTLAAQTEDAFTDYLSAFPCQILRPGRGFDHAKRITIATLQTMINEYDQLSSGYFDLVITDECHRSIYGKWSGVLRHFDGIQLGLTATPCTVKAEDMPDPEDGLFVRDTLRFFEVDKPTFSYTLSEAIENGHLVPYRIYKAMTVKTAADGGFDVRRDELDWSAMDAATKAEFEELFGSGDTIVVHPNALERKFTIVDILNRAVSIERLRARASSHLRDLIPALFIKMFGDPIDNPMGWEVKPLGDVAAVGSGAGFPKQHQGVPDAQYPFLKVSDMNLPGNEVSIEIWNHSVSEETRRKLRAQAFPPGTVIFPKIGAAIATNKKRVLTRPSCMDNNVMGITPGGNLLSEYLHGLMLHKNLSDFASDAEPPSMRKTTVEEWRLMVPPLSHQQQYADLARRVDAVVRLIDRSAAEAKGLAAALTSRIFGDEGGAAGATHHSAA